MERGVHIDYQLAAVYSSSSRFTYVVIAFELVSSSDYLRAFARRIENVFVGLLDSLSINEWSVRGVRIYTADCQHNTLEAHVCTYPIRSRP